MIGGIMKAAILILIGFLLGIAFTYASFILLMVIAAGRSGKPPTKEEWRRGLG